MEKALAMTEHITDNQILTIARVARNQWEEIATRLGFTWDEISGYKFQHKDDLNARLRNILFDWRAREEDPTLDKVLQACDDAKIGPSVKRALLN
jgi:hypothetical protein